MNKSQLVSKDFIFIENDNGELLFKGDFEGFYNSYEDPWGQSGNDSRLKDYYKFSRKRIVDMINSLYSNSIKLNICEVGSGLGYVCIYMKKYLKHKNNIIGIDISATATKKALEQFGNQIDFFNEDITKSNMLLNYKQDIIVLNQVFWYLLENLDNVFENLRENLVSDGYVIISLTFLREQRYGNNIINGFEGMVNYFIENEKKIGFRLLKYSLDDSLKYIHDDGILLLQKAKI